MNGILLLIPFLLIRFGLLSVRGKDAVKRAAHFAPMYGNGMLAYWIYQLSNAAIFVYLCFLTVNITAVWWFYAGAVCYIVGLLLCAVTMIDFAAPDNTGLNLNGLYRFSRNPMYLSYFLFYIGCALLTRSMILCGIVLVFQISAHWIILSEEKWCIVKFGEDYKKYMRQVRRYI